MSSQIYTAMRQICEEKGLSYEAVKETIEMAMAAAYRKDFGKKNQNIRVSFEPKTGEMHVFDVKNVVVDLTEEEIAEQEARAKVEEEKKESLSREARREVERAEQERATSAIEPEIEEVRFNPRTMIMLSDAKDIDPEAVLDQEIRVELETPAEFGRMAAQTAKQVIIQRLREAERTMVYENFKDKEGQVLVGTVQRMETRGVLVDMAQATGIVPPSEQIRTERYRPGTRLKFYVKSVQLTPRGPEIVLSRASVELVKALFAVEVPEIASGVVEIVSIAREPGSRTKIAVMSHEDNIDPIGSCVGQRGTRVQTVIAELGGEKIDIIEHDDNTDNFIAHALSPAKVSSVETIEGKGEGDAPRKIAKAFVAPDQLSLAIGRGGQNVRLASKLTGYMIDIIEEDSGKVVAPEESEESEQSTEEAPSTEVVETPEVVVEEKPPTEESTETPVTEEPAA
ncbi:MAG: transcription termination factor NusA [bacterium]|nr:transcription termination factor NusA [bacterium]